MQDTLLSSFAATSMKPLNDPASWASCMMSVTSTVIVLFSVRAMLLSTWPVEVFDGPGQTAAFVVLYCEVGAALYVPSDHDSVMRLT